jgi:hypothetical protein
MNSKHPERDIDSVFKDAIDPAETEPSDKFWNRTYEEIIKRENKDYNQHMRRWKVISFTLSAAILMLAFYTFYIYSRVNNIEKQISAVEQKQTGVVTTTYRSNSGTVLNNQATAYKHDNAGAAAVVEKSHSVGVTPGNNKHETKSNDINIRQNGPVGLTRSRTTNSNPGSSNVGDDKNPLNNSSYGFGDKTLPGNYHGQSNTVSGASKDSNFSVAAFSPPALSPLTAREISTANAEKDTMPTLADNKNTTDTLAPPAQMNTTAGLKNIFSHLYISAFFSPELTDDIINANNPSGNVIVNNIKAGEAGGITYTTGLKVGYDVSSHWSILTGIYYHTSSFSILPTVVHAQWQKNTSSYSYSLITSAGTVEMPYYSATQSANDSLKASGNSSLVYIGIPLQARYDFLPGSNLDFYVEGGVAVNFLSQTQTKINWSTQTDYGNCTINNFNGLQNAFFVCNMGIGITYKISKGISAYLEPGMQGPLTPVSKNESITTYPYIFDFTLGLTYHF